MKNVDIKVYIVGAMALGLIGVFFMDYGASALLSQGAFLTNGFFNMAPTQLYHVGMWMVITCLVFSGVLGVRYIKEV